MNRATYRQMLATLNSERQTAERTLAELRQLEAQLRTEMDLAALRLNDARKRIRDFEAREFMVDDGTGLP